MECSVTLSLTFCQCVPLDLDVFRKCLCVWFLVKFKESRSCICTSSKYVLLSTDKKICRCCLVESWILNGWCLQVGVVPTQEALQRSRDADLDLVRDFPVLGDISCSWFNHVMWRKFRITIEGQSQRSLKSNNRCYDLGEHKRMELFTTVVLSGPFLVLILSVTIGGYGTKE